MKQVIAFGVGVLLATAVALGVGGAVSLPLLATMAIAVVVLAWLVVVVVLPWNLHFAARHLLDEMATSKARGVEVRAAAEDKAKATASLMVRVSVGLHVASAVVLAIGARLAEQPLGYAFAALFLLSTLFRPAVEYYRYVRRQLGTALVEVRYPRDDVMKLVSDVEALLRTQGEHSDQLLHAQQEHARLQMEVHQRSDEAKRKLDAVARRFEETIDRLTDNQEIISGIKAFLRLVQQPGPLPPGT